MSSQEDLRFLDRIARRGFSPEIELKEVRGRYVGAVLPLEGIVQVKAGADAISATILDTDDWQWRAISVVPKPFIGNPGDLFRPIGRPGTLVGPGGHGVILPDAANWTAENVLYVGAQHGYPSGDTYRFSVGCLSIPGPAFGEEVAAVREIYARGSWFGIGFLGGRPLVIRSLSEEEGGVEDELLSVAYSWRPSELHHEAVWNALSFITGNTLRTFALEYYNAGGALVSTQHRIGSQFDDKRFAFFHRYYGPLADDGITMLVEGFCRLLNVGFPIEVVVQHLLGASEQSVDVEAQRLVLAIHTAIEGWNKIFGFDYWIDDDLWKRQQRNLRKALIPNDLYDNLGEEMRVNIRDAFAYMHRTTMGWRERALFSALQIDVSDNESRRVLAMRDGLLHNGYFVNRWEDLPLEEKQQRVDDIQRLRRLTLLIVLKLASYRGTYKNPVTSQPETVDPCQLPAALAPDE